MNILIVKLSAIGDVIHTLPSLAALRRCYPEAHITWVVEAAAADLLSEHPDLNRVIVSGRKRWLRELRQGRIAAPLREMRSFLGDLRDRRYDLVIDFHGLLKSALIVLISGGRRKLGYDSLQELSGFFYNEKIPEEMGKHAVERYLDFVRHVVGEQGKARLPETPVFTIPTGDRQMRQAAALLGRNPAMPAATGKNGWNADSGGIKGRIKQEGGRFVAVNPVAFWKTKLWEDQKFAELGDRIREELGIGVVFTGGESAPLERICQKMRSGAVNLGGRTTLRELACIYRLAELLITTDTGPMHLAAAVNTPVVALFGPTDPVRTGPYGAGHRVIRKELSCMPCFRKRCETQRCMQEITVEEVFTNVRELLNPTRDAKGEKDGNP
ncbi:MAG: glycosyltransferase family 9 protein [Syntrophales bacterium]|nr:glycosyltransferase family 9 protein [Syntrophales bacterium]